MALWATSPDPQTLPQKRNRKKRKKEGLGPSEVAPNKPKQEKPKTQKRAFQLSINIFCVFVVKKAFLTTCPKTCAPPKDYKNWGFRENIFENSYASRNGYFGTPKSKSRNSNCPFLGPFSSLSTAKTQKCSETPIFIVF